VAGLLEQGKTLDWPYLRNYFNSKRESEWVLDPYFLGADFQIQPKAEWRLENERLAVDYVAWNESRTILKIIEVKVDLVKSDHVGQILGYRNFVGEAKRRHYLLRYSKNRRTPKRETLDLIGFAEITGVLVGRTFENSAFYAALGTDLELVRADFDWKRAVAFAQGCLKECDLKKWHDFTSWEGPGRGDF